MATIHLVSHTHWDREWYLTFQQFRLKLVHLVDHLLDILERDPEYKYFLLDGQAIILEDYLEIRPERKADLARFVKDGRLFIGPWYISPDEFLVSPESHIRNLLEGNRICQLFGAKMVVGYLPDTFGHIGQLPQILRGFGISTACFWRGLDDQPVELTWKSPDGSTVLVSYLRDSYGNAANLATNNPERFAKEVEEISSALLPFSLTGQVLLMNGMDHMEPSEELPSAMHAFQEKSMTHTLIHSNLPQYFDFLQKQISEMKLELPNVLGELRSSKHSAILRDVLSTRITIKQRNHACESALLKWVEPLSAWVQLLDSTHAVQHPHESHNHQIHLTDQKSTIHYAWKLLMQCHPHDSICGTTIDQVTDEMRVRFDQVDQISNELIKQNLQCLCNYVDTTTDNTHTELPTKDVLSAILVFNPNDTTGSGLVDINFRLDNHYTSFEIVDEKNIVHPHHQKGSGSSRLLSMILDKKGLNQGLGMIDEGHIAGFVVRDLQIDPSEDRANLQVTLSDHEQVDLAKWHKIMSVMDEILKDPRYIEYNVSAFSDPEIELSFVAGDVPAHGYRCYWIRGVGRSKPEAIVAKKYNPLYQRIFPVFKIVAGLPIVKTLLRSRPTSPPDRNPRIENEFLIVDASSPDGTLLLTDKINHQVFTGLNRFVDGADCGDVYNYSPPANDLIITARKVKLVRQVDPTCQKLIIDYEMLLPQGLSANRKARSRKRTTHRITSTISVIPGVPRVDIHTELENRSLDHRLKVLFPAPFTCSSASYDGHFEVVERPINLPAYDATWEEKPRREAPQRQFSLISNGQSNLTIAVRGLPEAEARQTDDGNVEIAVTLLRCIGWLSRDDIATRKGHAGPMGVSTPQAQMPGKHAFDYSIIPGEKDKLASIHQAYAFNTPLKAAVVPIHAGSLPSKLALIENSNPSFIITSIKQAQEDTGLIVRGYNLSSDTVDVTLRPYKIFNQAQTVNLGEEPLSPLTIDSKGEIHLHLSGNKIATMLFTE